MSRSNINPLNPNHKSPKIVEAELEGSIDDAPESWLLRSKNKLAIAAYIGAAALTFNELSSVKGRIAESAHWTVPAIITSETFATAGLAVMVASTGNKIGNPLTLRKRLKELKVNLSNSSLYRFGAHLNLAGATGTSAVIVSETLYDMPSSTWPLALGIAGLSTALSIPFVHLAHSENYSDQTIENEETGI